MALSEAQILAIIQANRALGADPTRVEITDLAKILNAVEDDLTDRINQAGGMSISGTPALGKVPKWNGTGLEWGDDLTATPGATATLEQTLTAGNRTTKPIIFNEDLAEPTVNGQAVTKTWLAWEPLTDQPEGVSFLWHQTATLQDNAVNEVMHFGWNLNAGGGSVNPAHPALGESWESNYNPWGNRWVEKHEFYVTPSGFTSYPNQQIRLSSYTIDTVTGGIDYYKNVGRLYLKRPYTTDAQSLYFMIQPGGLLGATMSLAAGEAGALNIVYNQDSGVVFNAVGLTGLNKRMEFTGIDYFKFGVFETGNEGFTIIGGTNFTNIDVNTGTHQSGTSYLGNYNYPFKGMAGRRKAGDPVVADIADGCFQVYRNTTTGEVRLWYNQAGTLKSVQLT